MLFHCLLLANFEPQKNMRMFWLNKRVNCILRRLFPTCVQLHRFYGFTLRRY